MFATWLIRLFVCFLISTDKAAHWITLFLSLYHLMNNDEFEQCPLYFTIAYQIEIEKKKKQILMYFLYQSEVHFMKTGSGC